MSAGCSGKEARIQKTARLCGFVTEAYILLMLTLFPLFTGLSGYIYILNKKFVFFAAATVLWLCITAVASLWGGCRPKLHRSDAAVLIFMVVCCLSGLCAPHAAFVGLRSGSCDGVLTYLLYGCIFIGVSHLGRPKRRYLYAFTAAYVFCQIIVLLQLLNHNPLRLFPNGWTYYDVHVQELGKFLGTVGNEDMMAAYHCLALPLLLAGFLLADGRRRWLFALPVALGAAELIWAKAAFGLVALTAALVAFFPALLNASPLMARRVPYRRCWLLSLAAFLALAVLIYILPDPGNETLRQLHSVLHGRIEPSFGADRIRIWTAVLGVIAAHPLLGVGPDCVTWYIDVTAARYSEALGEMIYSRADNAHNEFLQLIASFGAAGALPVFFLLADTLVRALRQWGRRTEVPLLLPALCCYLAQAFFNIGSCIVTPMFIIALALLNAAITQEADGDGASQNGQAGTEEMDGKKMLFYRSACCSNRGTVRDKNEDNFYFDGKVLTDTTLQVQRLETRPRPLPRRMGMGVFDGMGGLPNGMQASLLAANAFAAFLKRKGELSEAFEKMHAAVQALTEENQRSPGTTAAVLLFSHADVTAGNVGDSRIYLFRDRRLMQISKDHTDHALLEKLGVTNRAPTLTQYIGMPAEDAVLEPYYESIALQAGDRLLICSDGLSGAVPHGDITEVCAAARMSQTCAEKLVQLGLDAGGRDNITVLVCDII